jgi:predicted transcriptional regulator
MAEKIAITIHVDTAVKQQLEKLAAEEDRSMAKAIIRLIKDRLKNTTNAQL